MRLVHAFVAALTLAAACSHTSPLPPPTLSDAEPPPATLPPATVYDELVEAGCLSPDDSGEGLLGVVEDEHSDAEETWLVCLFAGGTTNACGAPCQ